MTSGQAADLEQMKALLKQLEWFGARGEKDGDVEKVVAKLRERIQFMEGQARRGSKWLGRPTIDPLGGGTAMPRAIVLERYQAMWPGDDPDAGFRRMVAEYSRLDPLPPLENLSRSTGIPVGALARFVLARYCTSGSDALLEMGPRVVRQMDEIIKQAETAGTDAARLDAYRALKAIMSWLIVPLDDPNWRTGERTHRANS